MSSSTVTRRFGTDVSNIPSDVLKNPKKAVKSQIHTPKAHVSKQTPSKPIYESPSRPLFDAMETLMATIDIDDEISIKSPISKLRNISLDYRYERDFLLSFQQSCKETIEDLIPEVIPGFVHPEPVAEMSARTPTRPRHVGIPVSTERPVSSSAIKIRSATLKDAVGAATSEATAPPQEWRVKPTKKQKPKEVDQKRLAARQKQIDIGMNTDGYRRFIESVPVEARTKAHPRVPDITQVCSKRSWDGQVRKWRRQLHDFDSPEAAGQDGLTNAADLDMNGDASSEEEYSSENEDEGEVQPPIVA